MRLSAIPLVNYYNINSFAYSNEWTIRAGDVGTTLYFQIMDLDKAPQATIGGPLFGFAPQTVLSSVSVGLRYLLGINTSNQPYSVSVTFPSNSAALNTYVAQTQNNIPLGTTSNFPQIDPSQVFTINAFQVDPNDSSVWSINLPSTISPNSGNVQFSIQEGGTVKRFSVANMMDVDILNNGSC